MNKYLCTVLMFCLWTVSSIGQNNNTEANPPILKKVAWHSDVGLGYQSYDPNALKASLSANNYTSDLSNNLFMINYGIRAVFLDKFSAGINLETGTTSDFVRSGTSVSLSKIGAGLKLGYDIWASNKHRISLLYQLGAEANILELLDDVPVSTDFGTELNQRTSHNLFSGNVSNRFLVRYDYLFKQKQDVNFVSAPALGIELGYNSAGNNSWGDIVNGPEINNSGLFVNLVFSSRVRYYKKSKIKP